MSVERKEIKHIAHLARIGLSQAEEEKFEKELSAILEFIAQLNELDTSAIEPIAGGTTLRGIMRDDELTDGYRLTSEGLMEMVPHSERGYTKVKAVFEKK